MSHSQPSLDLSREKTSPENIKTPPKTSPMSAGEELTSDQRPLTQPVTEDQETEKGKPPGSVKAGTGDPPICQGNSCYLTMTNQKIWFYP